MKPFVSVVIPCRNEIRFLGRCLDSILTGDYPSDRMEVLIADGESTDGTRALIEQYAAKDCRVRLIPNPRRSTPEGLNRAIEQAHGEVVARIDAHATVARDYLTRCVEHLEASGADNVGGTMRTLPQETGPFSEAIVSALSHRFGVGNSYFRIGSEKPRWVDTVFGGCWRREVFTRVGLFNRALERSQDMEFSVRLKAAGGRTLLVPGIRTDYYARSRFGPFVRHNFRNGEWAILPFLYSSVIPVSLRHLIPLFFLMGLASAVAVAPWNRWPLAAIGIPYLLVNFAATLDITIRRRNPGLLGPALLAFLALHLSYGAGSVCGLVKAARVLGRESSLELSRETNAWTQERGIPPGRTAHPSKETSCLPQR